MITWPYPEAYAFLERVFAELKRNQFVLKDHWHIDHLCYRTASQESYVSIKKRFSQFSELLIESEVNGRLISTFKLPTPVSFNGWEIDLVEVPAPKHGKMAAEGFEHFEVVCDLPFEEIKELYAQCEFDVSGLLKDFNQELEIPFQGFAIKFHHLSLESVINLESNQSVFLALKKSEILKTLRPFGPLIAGATLLGIEGDAKVDIFVSSHNFSLIKEALTKAFIGASDFKCEEKFLRSKPALCTSFSFHGAKFQIFAQRMESVKQDGYLHFLVEERLLKIGNESFIEKIKADYENGSTVDLAFSKVLGLSGDSFEGLLMLQKQNQQILKSRISGSAKEN